MNVGILGSGFIVPYFIENIKKIDGYHIVALWGRNEEKISKFKDDCDYLTTDLEKILSDEKIDTIYIALPNGMHYEFAKNALEHHKNVLLEKPFCVNVKEAKELIELANNNNLIIYEAIMTIHSPGYLKVKDYIDKLGDIKLIDANFSQFSRRYERFKNGDVAPAFDYKLAGGALMDIGVYNIHLVCGLFGEPKDVFYYPNMENGVDTSGILILSYGSFKATLINAKDCNSDSHISMQGTEGYIKINSTSSRCIDVKFINKNKEEFILDNSENYEFIGMKYELREFLRIFNENDYETLKKANEHTLLVQKVLEKAYKFCEK